MQKLRIRPIRRQGSECGGVALPVCRFRQAGDDGIAACDMDVVVFAGATPGERKQSGIRGRRRNGFAGQTWVFGRVRAGNHRAGDSYGYQIVKDASAAVVSDALEYYAEAIDDCVEQGFSEQQALKEIGSPAQACDAVAETAPVAKRAVAAATATRERKALVGVLLLVSAVFLVPLAFGLLGAAAGVCATIWAAVLVV